MAKVYFTDFKARPGLNLLQKFQVLLKMGGLGEMIETDRLVAIKVHFGEMGNLAYIRPNYLRVVSDWVSARGGKPFLTDANTLYKGSRSNAVDHWKTAMRNGFVYEVVGAPVLIADGLRGSDEVEVPINGEYVEKAKIGAAIAMADVLVSVSHFKGHEQTGFGGAIKNIGMGSASRAGKMEQHSDSKPRVVEKNCVACGMCARNCPVEAITIQTVARINYDKCIGCGQCIAMCQFGAISPVWDTSSDSLSKKMAEYSLAVLQNKKSFHVSFINNVSPDCDCWGVNDIPIAPDIGIAASIDPVALDQACYDLVCKKVGYDPFVKAHPDTSPLHQVEWGEAIGLGERRYELVSVAQA